jgi:hypothetical protein
MNSKSKKMDRIREESCGAKVDVEEDSDPVV